MSNSGPLSRKSDSTTHESDIIRYCRTSMSQYEKSLENLSTNESFKIAPHTILDVLDDPY